MLGYSGLGHFFLASQENEFAVCHPYRKAYKSYGTFRSTAEFEERILKDVGFSEHVLRPTHQDAIANLIGRRAPEEVYIPEPYPFLGGSEDPTTYSRGNFWVFAELTGMCHGFGSSSA